MPLGLAAQVIWARPWRAKVPLRERKQNDRDRAPNERETQHWVDVIQRVDVRFKETGAKPWFVIDREGDAHQILDALLATGELFTVRSSHNRVVSDTPTGERSSGVRDRSQRQRKKLRIAMCRPRILGFYEVDVPAGPKRTARKARVAVRCRRLTISVRLTHTTYDLIPVNVVWLHEEGTAPLDEAPLDWMLMSNHPIDRPEDVEKIVQSYIYRWRIEPFHKTWKSDGCDIEQSRLRRRDALVKWATILAAIAVRAERLKHLSRRNPDLPASAEFSEYELKALILLKRREKKRTETIGDAPSLALATRWCADLGGFTGRSLGSDPKETTVPGRPGALTIGRGLERVRIAAEILEELERGRDG